MAMDKSECSAQDYIPEVDLLELKHGLREGT